MYILKDLEVNIFICTWNRICREMGNNFMVELIGKNSETTRVECLTAGEHFFTSKHFDAIRTGTRCHLERKTNSLRVEQT